MSSPISILLCIVDIAAFEFYVLLEQRSLVPTPQPPHPAFLILLRKVPASVQHSATSAVTADVPPVSASLFVERSSNVSPFCVPVPDTAPSVGV